MLEKYKKAFARLLNWGKTKECNDLIDKSLENVKIVHKMRSVYCGDNGKNTYWACCDDRDPVGEKTIGPDWEVNCVDCLRIMGWK